jgi:DNA-binding transcriptional MocR family regulator
MRLNFTNSSPAEIAEGMKRLRIAIQSYLEHKEVEV